ncbi:cytochrome P450 3A56-like [Oppia nitens]|uniref:cytochrome P450 3A56-like n=1 Tax=Oppia nitens TaxID=1686743 RepID=UPI0023DC7357|nr:cytochrome P450 3A56-like [Oppia nitens]
MFEILGFSGYQLLIAIFTTLPLIYWYLTKNYNHWKKFGINGPKPVLLLGNLMDRILYPMAKIDVDYVNKYGTIYGLYNGTDPVLHVAEPEVIKQILVKDFNRFTDRRHLKTEHPIINKNLFNSEGDDWKRLRTITSPTFTSGKMKQMYHLVRKCLQEYLDVLDELAESEQPVDFKAMHQNLTMDVIASCAFATKTNAQKDPNNPFVVNGRAVFDFKAIKMIPAFLFPKFLNRLLGIRTNLNEKPNDYIFSLGRHMLDRRQKGERNNDFLQLLMNANADNNNNHNNNNKDVDKDVGESHHVNEGEDEIAAEKRMLNSTVIQNKSLTEDEIIAQSWLFLLAGFETTATAMGYISYELAFNKEIQEKLYNEVSAIVDSDGEFKYEELQTLPYLDAVISESLRMYPPLTRLERIASEPMKLGDTGIKLDKHQMIEIPVYAIHRSERYHKNADRFTPERFLPENRKKLIPYSYLPFGTGPRNCIGMRFALMEIKLAIAHMVMRYRFKTCQQTERPIQYMNVTPLLTAKSITLSIEKR